MISLFLSCSSQEKSKDKRIIPVADAIGTGEILNLSDYAKSVKYIPLETNDSVLIGRLKTMMQIEDKYVILDAPFGQTGKCLLFGQDGRFITQVGRIGHGSREYSHLWNMDENIMNNTIFLYALPTCQEYNMKGDLICEMHKIDSTGYHPWEMKCVGTNQYVATVPTRNVREYNAFLYEKFNDDNLTIIRTYPNYYQREKIEISKEGFGSTDGKFYRYKDQVRYWRSWDDTIFTFNEKLDLVPAYTFDFGKYKAPMEWMSSLRMDYDEVGYVYPQQLIESNRYLFIHFSCGRNAPEKYEFVSRGSSPGGWSDRTLMNVEVYGMFDKHAGKLTMLNQPIKHKYLGFRNDLDGGPCFWPKYISSNDEMVTWFTADELLDIYEQLPNPSDELRAVVKKLNPDDNPVLMVVQLK